MLRGKEYSQSTQKYHARSFRVLRERYEKAEEKAALDPILEEAGCLQWLQ